MKKFIYLLVLSVFTLTFSACSDDDEPKGNNQISITSNGVEIKNNDVVTYTAEADVFGEMVAGHNSEPSFKSKTPCKLEVSITLPENDLEYLQWCGITKECLNYKEKGTYTRVKDNVQEEAMEMHAHFKTQTYTTCKVLVDVNINGKAERTFFIEYIYPAK